MSKNKTKKSYDGPSFPHDPGNEVAFTKTKLPFGWLGNMAPFPVRYVGKDWKTTEHLFQALRYPEDASGPQGENIREETRAQKSPVGAKRKAKKTAYVPQRTIEAMSDTDLELMRMVLRLKVDAHPELKQKLLATGAKNIIEDCTARPGGSGCFWGAELNDGVWQGHNWLGNLWMELREKLAQEMVTGTDA